MNYVLTCLLLIGLGLSGCRDNSPDLVKTIDLRSFRLQTPADWEEIPGAGIDSQVGRLTNGRDELTYDYGWYSYNFRNEMPPDYIRTNTTIDGQAALVVRPKQPGKGIIGVYIQTNTQNKLVLSGRNIKDEETVLKMFESIRF
ncbi:hypothetical protein GCM10027341_06810 [Spirosoma knui]